MATRLASAEETAGPVAGGDGMAVTGENALQTATVDRAAAGVPDLGEHIRRTYAHFARAKVGLDGVAEGVERTRHGAAPPAQDASAQEEAAQLPPGAALHPAEAAQLRTVDRYGFREEELAALRQPQLTLPRRAYVRARAHADETPAAVQRQREALAAARRRREVSRIAKWHKMLEGEGLQYALASSTDPRVLRRRLYKGVPDRWRPAVWPALVRSEQQRVDVAAMLETPSAHDVQIDLDVPRTIRGHVQFRTRYGRGQVALFSVLHAWSLHCGECGYCQGMGPLAATLLCYMPPEETLSILRSLHDTYGYHELFRPGFPGLRLCFFVQQRLTEMLLPDVAHVLQNEMLVPSAYATSWYMTVYSSTVPFETHLRIWDAFLLDGLDVLVVVALGVLRAAQLRIAADAKRKRPSDWLMEALSAPLLPEDDDALMHWVQRTMDSASVRSAIADARREWAQMCADGRDQTVFL